MTPEEAITYHEELKIEFDAPVDADLRVALQLGIEALKFRHRWKQQEGEEDFPLLPGETKD